MERPAFKLITLLKRKPGMTMDEFVTQYENRHARIGEKYLKGRATRYVRRFLYPTNAGAADFVEPDYDVVMEIWFPDRAAYEATMKRLIAPEAAQEIAADEMTLFDRGKNRTFFISEHESQLT